LTNGYEILNKVWSNKNIIKVEIMWEMGSASGSDRYKATVTDNNASGRVDRGRCSGRESTSIGGDMVGGSSIEVPAVLRRLLQLECLKLGC